MLIILGATRFNLRVRLADLFIAPLRVYRMGLLNVINIRLVAISSIDNYDILGENEAPLGRINL